ncbi:MAG TPA: hypothetical protein VMM59_12590 [Thermohalobaculum sp.]|nr:hypothetical protein [Thermohalobaculum sp.]
MSGTGDAADPWTYDDFEVGAGIGTVEVALDERRLGLWRRIYAGPGAEAGAGDAAVPQGVVVAAMMEGFIKVIDPRPPGNIHAGQTLDFSGVPVRPGARLSIVFTCMAREIRRERRWVTFGVRVLDGETPVARGEIVSIWAK